MTADRHEELRREEPTMGLGDRTARQHESVASRTAGVRREDYWDFQPGQRVMTVDGFSGTIASVDDGPLSGTETYIVTLANGLGGGQYTTSQLSAINEVTASEIHLAQTDYPELGTIIEDHPDPALRTTSARQPEKVSSINEDYGDEDGQEECEICGSDTHSSEDHEDEPDEEDSFIGNHGRYGSGIDVSHGGEHIGNYPDSNTAEHALLHAQHSTGYLPNIWDNNGNHYNIEDHVKRWAPNIGASGGEPMHKGAAPAPEHGPMDEYSDPEDLKNHLMHDHGQSKFDLHPSWMSRPKNNSEMSEHHLDLHEPGEDHCPVEGEDCPWRRSGHTHQERDTSGLFDDSVFGSENNQERAHELLDDNLTGPTKYSAKEEDTDSKDDEARAAEQEPAKSWVHQTYGDDATAEGLDLAEQKTGPTKYSIYNPYDINTFEGQVPDDGGAPGLDEHNHLTWGGHSPGCGDTDGYSRIGQNDAVEPVEKQAAMGDGETRDLFGPKGDDYEAPCNYPKCKGFPDGWHTNGEHIDPDDPYSDEARDREDRVQGIGLDGNVLSLTNRQKHSAFDPWHILTTAAADPEFRFEVTASWSDVRKKAKRIRAEGGVHVTSASQGMVIAEVKGDHNVYETGLQRIPGRQAIAAWSCGCRWGSFHWGAADDFSRFSGRMCSHALSLQYEAQSRGMFGKDVTTDSTTPKWVPRKVVVKYDIDDDRNVRAPATAPDSFSVAAALVRYAKAQGEPIGEITLALYSTGMGLPAVQAAVNNAWGEPDPPAKKNIPGPTKIKDPNENPASAGWASAGDPDSWNQAGPSGAGVGGMISSLHQDEAMFEPEMAHEAFLPLLIPLAEGLLGGAEVAGAGAAAAGAGEAAAGAGAAGGGADIAGGLGKAVVRNQVIKKVMPGGNTNEAQGVPEEPATPDGPGQPNGGGSQNGIDYGNRAALHDTPEGALPTTDSDVDGGNDPFSTMDIGSPKSLEPEDPSFVSTGSVEDTVARFQATAGAQALHSGGTNQSSDGFDIALAAKEHLAKEALKNFSPTEQYQIINEGEGTKAANLDRLSLEGTHYLSLEKAFKAAEEEDDDESWLT